MQLFGLFWFLILVLAMRSYLFGKRIFGITIFFFFLTGGFQVIPLSAFEVGLGISKSTDLALIFVGLTFLVQARSNMLIIKHDKFALSIIVFLGFILVAMLYSLFVYGYEFSYVLRSSRMFFLLLLYFNFKHLLSNELESTMSILFFITIAQTGLFFLQMILGSPLLSNGTTQATAQLYEGSSGLWERFYNIPIFIVLFFYYGTFIKDKRGIRITAAIAFAVALVMTLHRSLILSLVAATAIAGGATVLRRGWFALVVTALLVTVSPFSLFFEQRLSSAFDDIGNFLGGGFESLDFKDTFSLRVAHVLERGEYVFSSVERCAFGAGFLTEDSPYAQNLGFIVGYPNDWGGITQVDTSDDSWSLLLIFTGFVGTMLYIWVFWRAILIEWQARKLPIARVGLGFLILYLLTSLTGSGFVDVPTFVGMPLVLALTNAKASQQNGSPVQST